MNRRSLLGMVVGAPLMGAIGGALAGATAVSAVGYETDLGRLAAGLVDTADLVACRGELGLGSREVRIETVSSPELDEGRRQFVQTIRRLGPL